MSEIDKLRKVWVLQNLAVSDDKEVEFGTSESDIQAAYVVQETYRVGRVRSNQGYQVKRERFRKDKTIGKNFIQC